MLSDETIKKTRSPEGRIAICKHCSCNIEPYKFGWKHIGFWTTHHRAELPIEIKNKQ